MDDPDLNLLIALDALLAEGSVTGAARRLGLSPSAMSRTLARLRAATGDPLLVRAGRGLVPTPRAVTLREPVHALTREAQAMLRPPVEPEIASFDLTITIRANEGFVALFSVPLLAAAAASAPRLRVRFAPKPNKDARPLREGSIDLEIGVLEPSAPELRTRFLFRDTLVGIARVGHALLSAPVTAARYAACDHVMASPTGASIGPVDTALAQLGLHRTIRMTVPGFPDAMHIVRHTDLVAHVPRSCIGQAAGLQPFDLPVPTPDFVISAIWHPRLDADPAHRWLRDLVTALCRAQFPGGPATPKST